MLKWKVDRWGDTPQRVEVLSETACFVTVKEKQFTFSGPDTYCERRYRKDGTLFDSFSQAKDHMIVDAKADVVRAESKWQQAKDKLKKIYDMKEP